MYHENFKTIIKAEPLSGAVVPGFTLIEVLVAMVIITVGCVAAVYMQTRSMAAGFQAEQLTVATFLAESEYERLRSMDSADITDEIATGNPRIEFLRPDGASCTGEPGVCDRTQFPYQRTRTITIDVPTSYSHWLLVEMAWRNLHGPSTLEVQGARTDFSF